MNPAVQKALVKLMTTNPKLAQKILVGYFKVEKAHKKWMR